MRVYIAGPYSNPDPAVRDANVAAADEAARELTRLGHTPYCPHKMTWRWEEDTTLTYEDFLRIDLDWLTACDVLLYLGSSTGADRELCAAQERGMPVFYSTDEVPRREEV